MTAVRTMSSKTHEIRPGQSIELLKELHILTRDGKMNQDSRRKLKQVYHLFQFIEPLLKIMNETGDLTLADHGAGKSYLGFILYDLFFKALRDRSHIYGIETREELVTRSEELAARLGFGGMSFLNLSVAESITSDRLPRPSISSRRCMHAIPQPTTRSISPCRRMRNTSWWCRAVRRKWPGSCARTRAIARNVLTEIWRHPLHTREFGSQITNVLRCLQLESHGYQVSVTELVGWEHSMKNELIIAQFKDLPRGRPAERLSDVLETLGLEELRERFFIEA